MQPAPIKPVVTAEVLNQIDVRVGTIERVEEVPKSDKLVCLIVNFGDHTRSICAGMKQERANVREVEGRAPSDPIDTPEEESPLRCVRTNPAQVVPRRAARGGTQEARPSPHGVSDHQIVTTWCPSVSLPAIR